MGEHSVQSHRHGFLARGEYDSETSSLSRMKGEMAWCKVNFCHLNEIQKQILLSLKSHGSIPPFMSTEQKVADINPQKEACLGWRVANLFSVCLFIVEIVDAINNEVIGT